MSAVFLGSVTYSQKSGNSLSEIATWTLIQFVPSPALYHDNNDGESRLQFGLKWSITPFNYSFNANRLISPVQFFKVNPMRRFGGSVELLVEPEWTTSSYKYSDLERFSISPGARFYIPLVEYGEYLSSSIGFKYTVRKDKNSVNKNTFGIELGTYTFYGMAGLNFTYNFTNESRYNFSFSLRYY